jgi:hypothetical protein
MKAEDTTRNAARNFGRRLEESEEFKITGHRIHVHRSHGTVAENPTPCFHL